MSKNKHYLSLRRKKAYQNMKVLFYGENVSQYKLLTSHNNLLDKKLLSIENISKNKSSQNMEVNLYKFYFLTKKKAFLNYFSPFALFIF